MGGVLEDRVAVVTGSSRGIGRATALRFAREGARLVVNGTTEEGARRIESEAQALGAEALGLAADVAVREQAERLIGAALERFGRVDVLVNNAGVYTLGPIKPPWEYTTEEWARLRAINLDSVFWCSRAVMAGMLERRSGAIVNVTSLGAQAMRPVSIGPYSAAKAGVIGLTMSWAAWAGPLGVRVNAVSPGMIDTDIHADLTAEQIDRMVGGIPLRRQGTPDETADSILFLASDASRYITGTVLDVNGGLHGG
jgi:3-oxoacyl-[acyl-carrier protein] reductase